MDMLMWKCFCIFYNYRQLLAAGRKIDFPTQSLFDLSLKNKNKNKLGKAHMRLLFFIFFFYLYMFYNFNRKNSKIYITVS